MAACVQRVVLRACRISLSDVDTATQRKNKRRGRMEGTFDNGSDAWTWGREGEDVEFDYVETRPIRRRDAVEAGLDYWMDEKDLEKERLRRIATKNRKVGGVVVFGWKNFFCFSFFRRITLALRFG